MDRTIVAIYLSPTDVEEAEKILEGIEVIAEEETFEEVPVYLSARRWADATLGRCFRQDHWVAIRESLGQKKQDHHLAANARRVSVIEIPDISTRDISQALLVLGDSGIRFVANIGDVGPEALCGPRAHYGGIPITTMEGRFTSLYTPPISGKNGP